MNNKSFSSQFMVRRFSLATDIAPLVHLRRQLGVNISEEAQRSELTGPNQAPEQDRWVVATLSQPDVFLGQGYGYHTIPERYLAWIEVHPDWRRKGLGSALLSHIIRRAQELDTEHILINPDNQNNEAHRFLHHHSFQAVSDAWFMSTSTDIPLAEPVWPIGYTTRSFAELQDYRILQETYFQSCSDMCGHGANSKKDARTKQPIAADWATWFPNYDLKGEGIFFAFAPDGQVAGLCRGILDAMKNEQDKPIGYIDALGIVPRYRTYALQRPLTLTVMHWLRSHGQGAFMLEAFGTELETIKLYRELGFHLDMHLIAYQLNLK